jgi:hypothetical protein
MEPRITFILDHPGRFRSETNVTGLSRDAFDLINRAVGQVKYNVKLLGDFERSAKGEDGKLVYCCTQGSRISGEPLEKIRGYIHYGGHGQQVYTFHPQDCVDPVNIEARFRAKEDEESDTPGETFKDSAKTQWKNMRAWFASDVAKLLRGVPAYHRYDVGPIDFRRCTSMDMISVLQSYTNTTLYFDIETDPRGWSLSCFSICQETGPAFSWLMYDYKGELAQGAAEVLAALGLAFRRNLIVIHNAAFDANILTLYYKLPLPTRIFDTMLAQHRILRGMDKSLAHCITFWINRKYHKDEALFVAHNRSQEDRLLRYNASDVLTMRQIHKAMLDFLAQAPAGYAASVKQVMESAPMYLDIGYTGLPISLASVDAQVKILRQQTELLERSAKILTGISTLNLNSSKQLGDYLFTRMGYKPVSYTKSKAPSVDELSILKLAHEHKENLVLNLLLKYKGLKKSLSSIENQKTLID